MKKCCFNVGGFIFFFLSLGSGLLFAQYPSQNITMLSHWDTVKTISEPIYNIRYSSPWGWANPSDNKEYAILGSTDGTYFIEVTNPTAPKVRAFVPGRRDSCVWREYKTYQKYLYAVSDDAVNAYNQNSLQIIDMSGLPNSVSVVYDQDTLAQRTHSLFIDESNAKLYLNSVYLPNHGGHSNMAVCSLANPIAPTLLRMLEQDYPSNDNVHDCYVRNDTCYASESNSGLFIYKLNSNNHLTEIGSLTSYPNQGYNHSSALTANGKTLIFADEVPVKLPVKSLDVSNLSNLTVLQEFKPTASDTATPHNPFIRNGDNSHVVIAYYQSGVQIFDISNPSNIYRTGFFDTSPLNCPACPGWSQQYSGCWGVYVDLPSKIILASDMQNGLFVLDASAAMNVPVTTNEVSVDVFPNPFTNNFQLNFSFALPEKIMYELADITGKIVLSRQLSTPSGKTQVTIDGKSFSTGTYILTVKSETLSLTKKIMKTNK